MAYYFDAYESINSNLDVDAKSILETIAYRYMGQNPSMGPVYRVFNKDGFVRTGDYRYILNFGEKYPNAEIGDICYAWAKLWSDSETDFGLAVTCKSPVAVFWNGQLVFKSDIVEETNDTVKKVFIVKLNRGWNNIVVRCKKVRSGFGCVLGTGSFKRNPFHFLAPTIEREGQEGFIFTEPLKQEINIISQTNDLEQNYKIKWYPTITWSEEQRVKGQFERVYGLRPHCFGLAWTTGIFNSFKDNEYEIRGYSTGPLVIYLEGEKIVYLSQGGNFRQKILSSPAWMMVHFTADILIIRSWSKLCGRMIFI